MRKLSKGPGNLVRQVEMLKDVGVRSSKALPRKLLEAAGGEDEELALSGGGTAEGESTQE